MRYADMTQEQLRDEYQTCQAQFRNFQAMSLRLNMARGKPNPEQLALSDDILSILRPSDCLAEDGTDCRNYGGNDGLPEMKRLFSEILDVEAGEVIVGGNSSLSMMFDSVAARMERSDDNPDPWRRGDRFLCPSPGYDRHFTICEYFGLEMVPIAMTPHGPDMDAVEQAVTDPSVKGMWCVPVFSNPQGYVYTDETVSRLAAMKTAAPDFRLFWDNAYTIHHFRGERPSLPSILRLCERFGHPDRPLLFTSFSKITYAGAAVAAMAASHANITHMRKRVGAQTVGPDKLNQLRHVRFFKNLAGVTAHMDKLAALMRPKFEWTNTLLAEQLSGKDIAWWHCPDGGYFLSFDTLQGCAKRTVSLCAEAGVEITAAGATYPYKRDPDDQNIRIAPSYPSLEELRQAMDVFCVAVKIAAIEKLMP